MGATLSLLNLAGAIALLMWGVHMVQSGVQRAFGANLKRFLERALGNRLKAAAAGLGVTAVLQSSTATGLMIASFASSGLVELAPALAVMLGANIGTTLIVQVLSFDVARISPLLILAGLSMFRAGGPRVRDLGRVGIGLGLMLMALSELLQIITPYEDVPSLRVLMGGIATDPIISILFGVLIAWAAHSSVAVVLLIMSFAAKGVIPFNASIALTIGANIGAALNPLLEGSRRGDLASRRVGLGNLATRLIGAIVVFPFIPWIGTHIIRLEPDFSRATADFHTMFNLALALVFLPLIGPFSRALQRFLPDRIEAADPSRPLYLDPAAREIPSIALGHAAREALRMADFLDVMIESAGDALKRREKQIVATVRKQDETLDRLDDEIKRYLTSLDPDSLTDEEHRRLEAILTFALNLGSAGDVIERDIMSIATKLTKRAVDIPAEHQRETDTTLQAVRANLRAATSVFMTEDPRAARILTEQKTLFRRLEADAIKAHFAQMRGQDATLAEAKALHLDLLRYIKRLNDHLIAGSAYPVLEAAGELMPSRLSNDPEG